MKDINISCGAHKHNHLRDLQMFCKPRVTDWLGIQTHVVLNLAVMKLFDLMIRRHRGLSVLVCIVILFYFILYAKGDYDLGRIDMKHKVLVGFGTQEVAWVGGP